MLLPVADFETFNQLLVAVGMVALCLALLGKI